MQSYKKVINPTPPRKYDLTQWYQRGIIMLDGSSFKEWMSYWHYCRFINQYYTGLIIILIGYPWYHLHIHFDPSKHDVRTLPPYFKEDDKVYWNLK